MDVVSFCGVVSITLLNEGGYRGMASPLVMRIPTNRIEMYQYQQKSPKAQIYSGECSFSLPVSTLVVS